MNELPAKDDRSAGDLPWLARLIKKAEAKLRAALADSAALSRELREVQAAAAFPQQHWEQQHAQPPLQKAAGEQSRRSRLANGAPAAADKVLLRLLRAGARRVLSGHACMTQRDGKVAIERVFDMI